MKSSFAISEVCVNHNGSEGLALKLVDVSAKCGADTLNFQTFKADKLVWGGAANAAYQPAATVGGAHPAEHFGHSFSVVPEVMSDCLYGGHRISAAVQRQSSMTSQFQPERNDEVGLVLRDQFLYL